jgi:hypothetical protein
MEAYRRFAVYQAVQSAGPWRIVVARMSVLVVAIMAKRAALKVGREDEK